MANSFQEYPLSSAKRRHLFGGSIPAGCALPEVDNLAARYSCLDRKPHLLQASRGFDYNTKPWQSSYNAEYRAYSRPRGSRHAYHEAASDEMAAHPGSVTDQRVWATGHDNFLEKVKEHKIPRKRDNPIPGLEGDTYLNFIPWLDPKPIVNTDPRQLIPKQRDIRHIRKYREKYLDDGLADDESRHKFKLNPPSVVPPLTRKQVETLLVAQKPYSMTIYKANHTCPQRENTKHANQLSRLY